MCVVPDKHEKYGKINRLAFRRKEADMCQVSTYFKRAIKQRVNRLNDVQDW